MKAGALKRDKDIKAAIEIIAAQGGDIFHEWGTPKAKKFFKLSGISRRNWSIFMRNAGLADGKHWTLRAIAEKEDISYVRVWQIIQQTRKNLKRFVVNFSTTTPA